MGAATSQDPKLFNDYEGFVEKFKPKRTTDDCYTPPEVYEVVAGYVSERYGVDRADMVRPFWPGGDYEHFDYPDGCCVVDNPPFSMISRIEGFYLDKGVPFFLFAPSLTLLGGARVCMRCCHVVTDCQIEYENGAVVRTSFVTSLEDGVVARTAPDLTRAVNAKVRELRARKVRELPKYEFPDHVVTAAMMQRWAKYGVEFAVGANECCRISKLDEMNGKGIYGGGLLLSDEAAMRRAEAECEARERAATRTAERKEAYVYGLSDREREMVAILGNRTEE